MSLKTVMVVVALTVSGQVLAIDTNQLQQQVREQAQLQARNDDSGMYNQVQNQYRNKTQNQYSYQHKSNQKVFGDRSGSGISHKGNSGKHR